MSLLDWLLRRPSPPKAPASDASAEADSTADDMYEEAPHYYFENGLMVMTAAYHLDRGYCCGSGCRHCPFGDES